MVNFERISLSGNPPKRFAGSSIGFSIIAAPAPAASLAAGEVVASPMPGNILKVCCAQGDSVKAGDILIILEAMKMENEIMASKGGTVTQVLVSKGSAVDTGAPLVVIG